MKSTPNSNWKINLMQKFLMHSTILTAIFIITAYIYISNEKNIIQEISKARIDETATPLNATKKEPVFSLLFVGDVMLDRGVKTNVNEKYDGNYLKLFDFIKTYIARSDVSSLNLEGPASDKGSDKHNLYSFRMDPQVLSTLRRVGFNLISFSNNHVGDWGREAFDDTVDRAEHKDFIIIGTGKDYNTAKDPVVLEKNGIKVGFLSFSDVGPEALAAGSSTSGILMLSDPNLESIIRSAKEKADYLVVEVHWGEEYSKDPTERQIEFGHNLIDWGATLVVGHHPHVIEPTEKYKDGLITYSLGNFIFDQRFSKETMEGGILNVSLSKKGIQSYTTKKVELDKDLKPSLI